MTPILLRSYGGHKGHAGHLGHLMLVLVGKMILRFSIPQLSKPYTLKLQTLKLWKLKPKSYTSDIIFKCLKGVNTESYKP